MTKFQKFLRNHIMLVGMATVLVPLLSLLALQYWSLSELEETSTVADVVWRKNYLNDVSKEIKFFYRNNAEKVLNIPASSIENGVSPETFPFGKCSVDGAKRLFIATFDGKGGAEIIFYDPYDQSRTLKPPEDEVRTANMLVAPLRILNEEGRAMSGALTIEERDPENRVMFKPIINDEARVIGAAGMIIDKELFGKIYLPQTITTTLPRFFPSDKQDSIIVTVYDEKNQVVFSTQPIKGLDDESYVMAPLYSDWRIAIRSRHRTPAQWAAWNFKLNLTFSILMTVALLSGIILALRAAQRQMRLSQMKTDFVSNVSHELRTPLASIRVFGEFLKMGRVSDEDKIREYGEYIETESRRLTQLVNNILDFSRIESGRKTYDFSETDPSALVHSTLKTFDIQLKQRGFNVHVKEPQSPLPPVFVDGEAIGQVLINLLDNAIKYSGEAREIEIRLGHANGFVQVAVEDHGIGLTREDQQKVFDKFYRVCTGLVHETRGSGLGLALVKHIIEAHKGRVTLESEPGRGSTFTIHLPAKERTAEETSERKQERAAGEQLKIVGGI
ncbi:MAG: HAMP domain-containing histidine kinase [Pyrinomonadaceae bacterium]|nr:HAMP domain-containing histidine kinase [Pyrinomonadaceae bacterium]